MASEHSEQRDAASVRASGFRLPRFACEPVDETFFDAAPLRLQEVFDIHHPAGRVWADLTADGALTWCRIVSEVTWTSRQPFGVGTRRTARLLGGTSVIREVFFRWEDGRRQSFYAVEATTPMFRRLAEDYLVEPTSDNSCQLAWTIALEPRTLGRMMNPVNKRLLSTMFTDTRKHYGLR